MKTKNLLIVGDGRAATHLKHYIQLKNLNVIDDKESETSSSILKVDQWSRRRNSEDELFAKAKNAQTILLLTKDDAIESFIEKLSPLKTPLVHFSGALHTPRGACFHPLVSFGPELYDLKFYESIFFVAPRRQDLRFEDVFVGFKNQVEFIEPELKPYYHALCVLAGSGTVLLWRQISQLFEKDLGLSTLAAAPYMKSIFENSAKNLNIALTGPIARQDSTTIQKNISSLGEGPLRQIYESLVDVHKQMLADKRRLS